MYLKLSLLLVVVWGMSLNACAEPPTSPLVEPDPPDTVWVRDHNFFSQNSIFFSPDGKYIFCSSRSDHRVNVLQTSTGDLLHRIEVGTDVSACTLSPNGKVLAVAGADEKVSLWDAHTYTLLHLPLEGHTPDITGSRVIDVDFSPDSQFLVSSSSDDEVIVWEVSTGKEVFRFGQEGDETGWSVFLGDSGEFMYTTRDSLVFVHLPEGAITRKVSVRYEFGVNKPQYSSSLGAIVGQTLVERSKTEYEDRMVVIDPKTGEERREFYNRPERLKAYAVTSGGRYIVITTDDGYIQTWETATGTLVRSMAIKNEWGDYIRFWCVAVSPDSTYIVTAVDAVYLWHASWNPATSIGTESVGATVTFSAPYPVPGSDELVFRYTVPTASDVVVEVYNTQGERIAVVAEHRAGAGEHTALFHPSAYHLATGTYYCRLIVNNTLISTHSFPIAK